MSEENYEEEWEDIFESTEEDIDNFEEYVENKGEGYKTPNFPILEEKVEGLEAGMYLFAGESNSGKTALMMNMLFDLCTCEENNLFGVYYSLDDSRNEIFPRFIAMDQMIPIGAVSKPKRYQDKIDDLDEKAVEYEEYLDKRKIGIERMRELKTKLKILDGNRIKSAEQLHSHIEKVKIFLEAEAPEKNLIVAIDALNDIRFSEKRLKPGNELNSEIAKTVKGWATEFDIPIFGSCHLRKINGNRRPVLDDLKESGEYVYEASLTWLVHNEVSKNKQASNIYFNITDSEEKMPILEIDWAKNKKSSFKGRTYCYFLPEMSKLTECDKEASKRFDALIYEN